MRLPTTGTIVARRRMRMISGSGFVARSEAMTNYLDSIGIKPIADVDAARSLGHFLRAANPYATYANLDWTVLARSYPGAADNPRLKALTEQRASGQSRIMSDLAAVHRSEWEGLLAKVIGEEVARVLKVDASALSANRKLSELGLDSLSTFELKNRIEGLVDVSIPVARFLQTPTNRWPGQAHRLGLRSAAEGDRGPCGIRRSLRSTRKCRSDAPPTSASASFSLAGLPSDDQPDCNR
jgi:acyl carrier protein